MAPVWPIPSDLKTVLINDYPMTYAEYGAGPPLVLVDGSITDYRVWADVIPAFAARHRVIAPNLRHYFPESWNGEGGNFSAQQ